MKRFFHLSKCAGAIAIVASTDRRGGESEKFFSPRTPRSRSDEVEDRRICVAPTVWQCLISGPEPATPLYIYSLTCRGAIAANGTEHRVADAHVTHEHWINDAVIRANEREIRLIRVGALAETQHARFLIRHWREAHVAAGVDPSALDEFEHIWLVDRTREPNEWSCRYELPTC